MTLQKCQEQMICRGLTRVWYTVQLERIYNYLCIKNIINYGIIPYPRGNNLLNKKPLQVVIIGAGISGLTTARQLKMKGVKVTVLEATDRLGIVVILC